MSSIISVLRVAERDIPRLAEIDEEAYADNAMRKTVSTWSTAGPELRQRHLEASAESLRSQFLGDRYAIFFKVVVQGHHREGDDSERILGWASLRRPGFMVAVTSEPRSKGVSDDDAQKTETPSLPPCMVPEAVEKYMKMWMDALARNMGERNDYWCLAKFSVLESGVQMGADEALVNHMLSQADAEGTMRDMYVGSPPDSRELMERNGFVALEAVDCLDGSWVFSPMLRKGQRPWNVEGHQ